MLILDGGIGRHLEKLGAPFRQPEWSALALMDSPEFVLTAHRDFISAGADIITTNSYAIVPFHIGEERFLFSGPKLLKKAGALAKQAKTESLNQVLVAASIPPVFGSYIPKKFDPVRAPDLLKIFKDNLLESSDIILAETMSSILEIQIFLRVFSNCDKPIWVSITLEDENAALDDPRLRSKESLMSVFTSINFKSVNALLFNCSQPEVMETAIRLAKKKLPPRVLIGVYANAFPPQRKGVDDANKTLNGLRVDLSPKKYQNFAINWINSGADIIGGCCGIGPDYIKKLKELKNKNNNLLRYYQSIKK